MAWAFWAGALACVGGVGVLLFTSNPSGDYLSGMGQLIVAVMGAAGAVLLAVMAVLALMFHHRPARICAGVLACALVAGGLGLVF